jgi:hypothetical protein
MPLSLKQIKLIQTARSRLRLGDDDYRAILEREAGVTSSTDLDNHGFDRVVACFEKLGFKNTSRRPSFGERRGMATPAQVDTVRKLWREWHGKDDDDALGRWLERSFKLSALRFLDQHGVHQAINGLRAMTKRKRRAPPTAA